MASDHTQRPSVPVGQPAPVQRTVTSPWSARRPRDDVLGRTLDVAVQSRTNAGRALARCGCQSDSACSCDGGRVAEEEASLPGASGLDALLARSVASRAVSTPAGAHATADLPARVLSRATAITDDVHLASALLTSNTRLESAFHNDPPLTPSDDKAAIAVLQEALENAFRTLPKSHEPDGRLDGKWGTETKGALRDYQSAREIPPGGHEAGRRTLAALDADLKGGPKPKPKPAPKPTPPGCSYDPGEREKARKNDGDVEVTGNRFRFTGFSPGEATLKPKHEAFLRKLVVERPFQVPQAENALVVGITDCVSEEVSADRGLRLARARAVARFVSEIGGPGFGTVTAVDDPIARITGDNNTPALRAHNRAAEMTFSSAVPPTPPPKPKLKQTFFFRLLGATGGGEFGVCEFVSLQVVDFDRLLQARFLYRGCGPGGGTPFFRTTAGKFTRFENDLQVTGERVSLFGVPGSASVDDEGAGDSSTTKLQIGRGFGTIKLDGETFGGGISKTFGSIKTVGPTTPFDPKDIKPDDGGA